MVLSTYLAPVAAAVTTTDPNGTVTVTADPGTSATTTDDHRPADEHDDHADDDHDDGHAQRRPACAIHHAGRPVAPRRHPRCR